MGRVLKRERVAQPSPPPAPVDNDASPSQPAAKSQRNDTISATTRPERVLAKKFLPDTSDLESTEAASVRSDESVRADNSQEREDALVAVGSDLSGDALKAFLQSNFVDYIDEKIFDIPNLDLPSA